MNTQTEPEDTIAEEAIAWLISLRDAIPAPGSPYQDPSVRSKAFFDWLKRSPAHLRLFMEYMELERRVGQLDPAVFAGARRLSEIQELSDVPLAVRENPAQDAQVAVSDASAAAQGSPALEAVALTKFLRKRRRAIAGAIAAGCAAIAVVAGYFPSGSQIYSTHIGGQQRQILQDGSVIQLNTNSQVEVNFSKRVRAIRLIRGEAFFSVKHSSSYWPFIVTAADTSLRAVGTEFDVRQTPRSVAVAVVSGTVQAAVEPPEGNAPTVLSGGEIATFSSGKVTKVVGGNVDNALSWRQNRLVFDHARLSDVAETFNRYNHVQIRVEGIAAQDTRLTGIFDTGGYRDFLWHAQTKEHLSVSSEGENWVIRSHE